MLHAVMVFIIIVAGFGIFLIVGVFALTFAMELVSPLLDRTIELAERLAERISR